MKNKTQNQNCLIIESAEEFSLKTNAYKQKGIDVNEVKIDNVASRKTGRKVGTYITVSPDENTSPDTLADVLHNAIKKLIRQVGISKGKILIVGLGNENVIVDALGCEVIKRIRTGGKNFYLSAIAPKVADMTGLKSFDIVKAICDYSQPDLIIAIDTLATKYLTRLGNCFQLTTAGICPGGGVDNPQPCLDKTSLLSPVIAIGVPLIISIGSILSNNSAQYANYMVTPRDVDSLVDRCASAISTAINKIGNQI